MLRLFLASQARLAILIYRVFIPGRGRPRPSLKRLLVMSVFLPLFALVQGVHWAGLLLDEILFPGYRRVRVREPLFVLGVPRSGTTHLHRVLSEDDQYTTFSTWECLFALSVTARRFWLGLARLDRGLGRPMGRLLGWLETHAFGGLQDVHSMRLSDAEEDYFALMPALATFILVLPFPSSDLVWRMGTFDRDMPEPDRQRLLELHYRCVQRHLYVHGEHKRLLSKNAAFAPLAGGLAKRFPDARFVVCLREPEKTLPSQLSSIEPGIRFFDSLSVAPDLRLRLTRQLAFYYENLHLRLHGLPEDRCAWVTMRDLQGNLRGSVLAIYRRLGLPSTRDFEARLSRHETKAQRYRSAHRYSLEQFGLSQASIDREIGGLYRTLATRSVLADEPREPRSGDGSGDPQRRTTTTEPAMPC